jgi:phage shock protein PspC (stress-responsive transcriptional regulator)
MSTDSDTQSTTPQSGAQDDTGSKPPLRRAVSGRMLAGVASGLARYFGIDANVIRIVFVVLGVLAIVGSGLGIAGIPFYLAGIPLYLACWLLIPEEGNDHSIAANLLSSLQDRSR